MSLRALSPAAWTLGRRIVIAGAPASGKTTLARRLGANLGLPVIEIDALLYGEGWHRGPDAPPLSELLKAEVDRHTEGWVCDGPGPREDSPVLAACDTLIRLRLPLRVVVWRAGVRRLRRLSGRDAEWAGPREPLSRSFGRSSFLYWLAIRRRSRSRLDRDAPRLEEGRVITIRTPADLEGLLALAEKSRASTPA